MSADIERWEPPNDATVFESLCLDLWKDIWQDGSAQKNGRNGQAQAGVDVVGQEHGEWVGIQCKQKDGLLRKRLTVKELNTELKAARKFTPPLSKFILATTSCRDKTVQQRARQITDEHRKQGLFSVEVWAWEDIWAELYKRKDLLEQIAPTYWPRRAGIGVGRRTNKIIVAGVALICVAIFAVWYGVPKRVGKAVVEASREGFDAKAARDRLRKEIETHTQSRIADARKRNASWQEINQIEEDGVASLARLDSLVEFIQLGMSANQADPILREATTILARKGIAEAFAYLQSKQPVLLREVEREAMARDAQEASLRRKLEPLLLQAELLELHNSRAEALALLTKAEKFAPQWWKTQNSLGIFQFNSDNWAVAEGYLQRALKLASTDNEKASTLNYLGRTFQSIGRLTEAESAFRQALQMDIKVYGTNHTFVAIDLDNLAICLFEMTGRTDVESLMRQALAINEAVLGPDHPEVAVHLNNLGRFLGQMGRTAEAEKMLRRSTTIQESSYGQKSIQTAIPQQGLAQLLFMSSRIAEAEPLARNALEITKEYYGDFHPDVAQGQTLLGRVWQAMGRYDEGEGIIKQALSILENCYGKDHSQVAMCLGHYAHLLQAVQRFSEAEIAMRRALIISEKTRGPDHPDTAKNLDNLGMLLCGTKRPSEGEPLVRRALDVFNKNLGIDHPDTKIALTNYVVILSSQGFDGVAREARLREVLGK